MSDIDEPLINEEMLLISNRNNEAEGDTNSIHPDPDEPWRWRPSDSRFKDFLHFVGPGWFVCIAYVDPGNYQADIQAGAMARYNLLWTIWWASILSIYVQSLCCRLAYYGQVTLAEVQSNDLGRKMRYLNWFIAEFSVVITDLPEVIGIGIAFNIFFGWPYYAGILLSMVTTFIFLGMLHYGMRLMELIVAIFVGVMSIVLFVEMGMIGVDGPALMKGWVYGFVEIQRSDIFSIVGIIGAVVMPHNLYLHSASLQSRPVERREHVIKTAAKYSSWEPVLPVIVSFFVNLAIVAIAAEAVFGQPGADQVGLSDFCSFLGTKVGCTLFGIALLSAGQSSAITTTYTGQYIMDGFLDIRLPIFARALITRSVAIIPCIAFAVAYPDGLALNGMINMVNALLSLLLPFAFTPLVKYNTSKEFMGKYAAGRKETILLYFLAFLIYLVNAIALSTPGAGFLGDRIAGMEPGGARSGFIFLSVIVQLFYLGWNLHCILTPCSKAMMPLQQRRPWVKDEFSKFA